MRAKEFITELNMAPGNLMRFAASTVAANMRAGFEAELIVSGAYSNSGEGGGEDWDEDMEIEPGIDINDIANFFDTGVRNRVIQKISDEYEEWYLEKQDEFVRKYIDDQIADLMRNDPDLDKDDANDQAREDLEDQFSNDSDVSLFNFLREVAGKNYSDIYNNWSNLEWPHWKSANNFESQAEYYSDTLQKVVPQRVAVLNGTHSDRKKLDMWYIEPDESIMSGNKDMMGIEVVSPPMPVLVMLDQMKNVFAWADNQGAQTNETTGLHIGVSIVGLKADQIDYVKLALFLGDQYVLQQFGREANTYTQSSLATIKAIAGGDVAGTRLFGLRKGLYQSVSRSIQIANTGKYFSINVHDDYIEFRSMGGDYLSQFDNIQNIVLRYVRAYAVAADPLAEKQEYAKKLFKIMNPSGDDRLTPFIQYAMGDLPKEDLVIKLKIAAKQKQADQARLASQPPPAAT